MKKIIAALFTISAFGTCANAQTIASPVSHQKENKEVKKSIAFAPEIGLNMADMTLKASGLKQKTSMKPGLAIGGVVDFGLSNNYYLQPGLFYLANGCNIKQNAAPPEIAPPGSINLNTIQLPVNVLYKSGKPGMNRLFLGIGPYVAYNISGTGKITGGSTTTFTMGDKPNASNIRPLDYGAGINAGYECPMGFLIRVHYQVGFPNLNPTPGGTETTSALGLTVGYLFGGKPKKA